MVQVPMKVVPSSEIAPGRRKDSIDPEMAEWDFLYGLPYVQ